MSVYEPGSTGAPHAEQAAGPPTDLRVEDLLASRGRRFAALRIDMVIVCILLVVGALLLVELAYLTGDSDATTALAFALLVVLWLAVALGYAPLLLSRKGRHYGQTVGKQLLRVRVVIPEGVPVRYARALRREFLGIWLINLVIGLYALIDYAWAFFDDRRQALHDKIGSTYVVDAHVPLSLVHEILGAPSAAAWVPSPPPHAPVPFGSQWQPGTPEAPVGNWSPPTATPTPGEPFDEARRAFGDDR